MVKYLVTGGCGFIGSHLVDLIIAKGHDVRVLDNLSNSTKKNLSPKAEWIHGSITDTSIWKKALEGVDGVFHLAAMVSVIDSINHWHTNHLINSGGTIALLERAKGIPVVYASSAAVYGDHPDLPQKESCQPRPLSPYAIDKLNNELHAHLAWELHSTPSIGFRLFNIYGPRQNPNSPYSGVISIFSDKIAHKQPITIYGDGQQRRDFVYVKDVARILFHGMQSLQEGASVYNLCTGHDTSINDLADLLGHITGTTVQKDHMPERKGEIRLSIGDPSKALHALGMKAEINLEQGLRELMREINHQAIVQ